MFTGAISKPSRSVVKPLPLAREKVASLGKCVEDLIQNDCNESDRYDDSYVKEIKKARQSFLSEIECLIDRLKDASPAEALELKNYKISLNGEVFRKINSINSLRDRENLDNFSQISGHLPSESGSESFATLMQKSNTALNNHNIQIQGIQSTPINEMLSSHLAETAEEAIGQKEYVPKNYSHHILEECSFKPVYSAAAQPQSSKFNFVSTHTAATLPQQMFISTGPITSTIPVTSHSFFSGMKNNDQIGTTHHQLNSANYRHHSIPGNNMVGSNVQTSSNNSPYVDTTTNHLLKQQLLSPSLDPFSGKSENFNTWIAILKSRMSGIMLTPFEQLHVILNNTTGTPKEIVQDYYEAAGGNVTDATLDLILQILRERYGSSSYCSDYIEHRINQFPIIRNSTQKVDIGRLIDLCRLIQLKTNECEELMRYNFSDGMSRLWNKLPDNLRSRWRTYGSKAKARSGGQNPNLSTFITYLREIHAEISDTFFQSLSISDKPKGTAKVLATYTETENDTNGYTPLPSPSLSHNVNHSTKVLVNQTNFEPPIPKTLPVAQSSGIISMNNHCILHDNSNHSTPDCKKFKKMCYADRKSLIWKSKRCFRCFGNHLVKYCKEKVQCEVCNRSHNTLMHDDSFYDSKITSNQQKDSKTKSYEAKNLCTEICDNTQGKRVCSKTLLIKMRHKDTPGRVITAYAIVDEQSSSSFVDPSVISLLSLQAPNYDYSLKTLSGYETKVTGKIIDSLQICGIKESRWYDINNILTNSFIPDTKEEVASPEMIKKINHLSHLSGNFARYQSETPVLMLLGADSGEVLHTICHGYKPPYAHQLPLGWALVGSACIETPGNPGVVKALKTITSRSHNSFSATPSFSLNNDTTLNIFKEFRDDELADFSKQEREFLNIMDEHIKLDDGYITMPLPFKDLDPVMPDNRQAVFHRTKAALSRIADDKDKLRECLKSMESNLKKGHIEVVPKEQIITELGKSWFLPVFAVMHPKKLKPRLVFDASASFQGVSLNDKLLQGPHLTSSLRAVLLRFRKNQIGITCDIEHMFYNFKLNEEHSDFLRFFWYKNNDPSKPLVQYRAKVHIFGASSSPAAASYGLRYAAEHTELPNSENAKKFILNNYYVDDGVTSVNSVTEGIELLTSTKKLLSEFNIKVHKISSSEPEILKAFASEEIASIQQMDFEDTVAQRTLGVVWDLKKDAFIAKAEVPDTPFTKRGILACVNSYYDPIGIASPVILAGRLIQRKVIPTKDRQTPELNECGWDDQLPNIYLPLWKAWKNSLLDAHLLTIPRCFTPNGFGEVIRRELHIFSDASIEAIGVVIYMRSININNQVHVAFVTAMSRVAPRAATSIPRLELNAALQASNLAYDVLKNIDLNLDEECYYTDSKVVLGYLNNCSRNFSRYVSRRVDCILKVAPSELWKYIKTDQNPADTASRPTNPVALVKCCWLTGPKFLHSLTLSNDNIENLNISEKLPEEKTEKLVLLVNNTTKVESALTTVAMKTSSYRFLLGTTTKVLTFVNRMLSIIGRHVPEYVTTIAAERKLVYLAQIETYPEIISLLSRGSHLPDKHPVSKLSPFIDSEGIIRVGGRIKNARIPFDHARPLFVPAQHVISTLLLQNFHERVGHQGRHLTHGIIRQNGYHFENGRKLIQKLISQCVTCMRLRGKLSTQFMGDLPSDRLECSPPFTNTGCDVFGPYLIHDGVNTRRTKATKKMYVLLLTCLVSRAVHLEPLPSMDTSSFINAMRRFFAIRGTCKTLRSDQGTNFIGAANQGTFDFNKLQSEAKFQKVEWVFNAPGASHFGAAWERKIGSIKRVLENTLLQAGNRAFSRDELCTFLQEAAAVVNSTPLYEMSPDPNDPCPITPNCLLTMKDNPNPPSLESYSESDLLQYGTKRWRRVQYLAEQFWVRWQRDYIHTLNIRRKWKSPKRNIQTGDIVLLRVKNVPRNQWPLARVTATHTSSDYFVRKVTVRIGNKSYSRCIHDLIVLYEAPNTNDCVTQNKV